MHLIDQCPRPVIFGHRGASKYAPENTLAAFDLAVQQGAPAVELDTMLCRDGTPVVIHDRRLDRTTNGSGFVGQFTFEELSKLDAGSSFSAEFRGEKIPALLEVLLRYRDKLILNIELKNLHAPYDRLAEVVVRMVDELKLSHMILYSSFWPGNLRIIKRISPQSKTALLCPSGILGKFFSSPFFNQISAEFIHPNIADVNSDRLQKEHKNKRRVHVWTVNDLQVGSELIQAGVDGIITDDPALFLSRTSK